MTDGDVTTWPFWAPSDLASVEHALDLAGLGDGETLVDLGCGDGQVLVAAAARGAHVIGVESDPELVGLARRALSAAGLDGEVIEGDLLGLDLDADVYFTYLAPATLQRLLPGLAVRRGTRLVTVDFDVPGLDADARDGAARLYRMPGTPSAKPPDAGWACAGALVVAPPDHQSLTVLDLQHPGGAVSARLAGAAADGGALLTGADEVAPFDHLAVDIRWEPHAAGTLLSGVVDVVGVDPFPVVAVFDADAEDGCWELSDEGVGLLLTHLERDGAATDGASLVRAAGG